MDFGSGFALVLKVYLIASFIAGVLFVGLAWGLVQFLRWLF